MLPSLPRLVVSVILTVCGGNSASVLAQDSTPNTVTPQIEQSRLLDPRGISSLPPDGDGLTSRMPVMAAASPADDDLGQQLILKKRNDYQPITIYLGTSANYTSNVGLSDGFEVDDWFWRTTAGISYNPRFGNDLMGNISVSQEMYRYDKFSELNFESLNLGIGLTYNLWFLYGVNATVQFDYSRITADDYAEEIFASRTVSLALSRNFIISRAQYFYVVGSASLGWSDPEQAARDEFVFAGGYHVRLARSFEIDLLYRLGLFHYTEIDREDVSQTVQLSARYNITKWLSANASVSASFNDSDRQGFDYEALNTGIGVYVSWKF